MKRLICKVFGHKRTEIVKKEFRGKGRYRRAWRVTTVQCARCGEVLK